MQVEMFLVFKCYQFTLHMIIYVIVVTIMKTIPMNKFASNVIPTNFNSSKSIVWMGMLWQVDEPSKLKIHKNRKRREPLLIDFCPLESNKHNNRKGDMGHCWLVYFNWKMVDIHYFPNAKTWQKWIHKLDEHYHMLENKLRKDSYNRSSHTLEIFTSVPISR